MYSLSHIWFFFFFGNSARVIQWKNDNIFILTYGISTSVWEKMDPSIHTMHKTDHEVNCITLWKIFSRLYIHFLVQLSNFSYRDEKLLSYENDSDIYSRTSLMLPLFPTQGTCVWSLIRELRSHVLQLGTVVLHLRASDTK